MDNKDLEKELNKIKKREAIEQTIVSWIQIGLPLIGLGFAITSIIGFMEAHHYQKPMIQITRFMGQLLIFTGFGSIILSLVQHRHKLTCIKNKKDPYANLFNLPLLIGIIISLLGVLAFLVTLELIQKIIF